MPYLNQWYWGHGRAGDLSVVWFYRIDVDGSIATSAYIAEGGEILWTGCGDGVVVRPYGSGVQYPLPVNNSAIIEGFTINIDTPSLGSFAFTAQQNRSVVSPAPYDRWIGEFTGGPVGGMNASGFGLWEKMGPFSPDVALPS